MLDDQKIKAKIQISLEQKKCFWGEIKNIFIIFKELSVAKNYLRPKSAPLIMIITIMQPILTALELQMF